jgi:hypothetical protein
MTRPRTNEIEIGRIVTAGGANAWTVFFNDLYFGRRHLERCWSKPDAIRAAKRLSRKLRVPFERDRRRRVVSAADKTKFAAWEKRQRLVAARAKSAAAEAEAKS